MKFAKLSIVALSLGVFVASCGNGGDAAKAAADSAANAATATPVAAPPVATPPPADTLNAGAAKPADTAKAAAPAAEAKKK